MSMVVSLVDLILLKVAFSLNGIWLLVCVCAAYQNKSFDKKNL